jgi:hypothetical protein
MSLSKRIPLMLFLLFGLSCLGFGNNLKVMLLDSSNGHGLHNKLVCISFPTADSDTLVIKEARDCHRTDSTGTVEFRLPDPAPKSVHIALASNGLNTCFSPETFEVAAAMKGGTIAKNTCGDASTDLTEDGEVIVFGHQMSLWESMKARSDEF